MSKLLYPLATTVVAILIYKFLGMNWPSVSNTSKGRNARKKSVLITGCSEGGIGAALAFSFHKHGFLVFATARNTAKIPNSLKELEGVKVLEVDTTSSSSVIAAVEHVRRLIPEPREEEEEGKLDVLVNNAGMAMSGPGLDVNIAEEGEKCMNVNFWGCLRCMQNFAPLMLDGGTVVNVGSMVGEIWFAYQPIYTASKAALHSLSESMRLELAPLGIRVLTVITGVVESNVVSNQPPYAPPATSFYNPISSYVRDFVDGKSLPPSTKADSFAEQIVNDVFRGREGKVWRGKLAGMMWFLKSFMPVWLLDKVFISGKGLDVLSKLRQKGRGSRLESGEI